MPHIEQCIIDKENKKVDEILSKTEHDHLGRIINWPPIKKKPKQYVVGIGPKVCSNCGKLYTDSFSMFCQLDGKWLIGTERLDFKRRQLLGFTTPSKYPEWMLVND